MGDVQQAIIDVDLLVHRLAAKLPGEAMSAGGCNLASEAADSIRHVPPHGQATCINCNELSTKTPEEWVFDREYEVYKCYNKEGVVIWKEKGWVPPEALGGQPLQC